MRVLDGIASETVWVPARRPQWLTQLNAIGENCGSPAAIVELREDWLIFAATKSRGLDDLALMTPGGTDSVGLSKIWTTQRG
jgi:hypothetical protein